MKIRCELCKSTARIYCDSDQARLCWDCDSKVHSANFLVARHSRNLLCHVCQSPTPWNASGEKLGATVSVCERCVETSSSSDEKEESDDEIDEEEYDGDGDEVDLRDDEDEDGENQVVPWSSTPPPAASSSSCSGEESSSVRFRNGGDCGGGGVSVKRTRADLCSEDDLDCASSQQRRILAMIPAAKSTGECVDSLPSRPSKVQKSTQKRFQATAKRTVSPAVPLVGI